MARVPGARRGPHRTGLALVLAATLLTLLAGYLIKLPCLLGPWDGRQYTRLCYSDVVALAGPEGRVPPVEADKYPVGASYLMDLVAVPASSPRSFFHWTVALWTGFALAASWALWSATGLRALLFAAAPTLAIHAFMSWDLPLVALASLGTLAYLRGRDVAAGLLLGVGGTVKVPYPAILAVPFAAGRAAHGRAAAAGTILLTAAGAWVALNLPRAVLSPARWLTSLRFNAARAADWDTVWFFLERHFGFRWPSGLLNLLAAGAFVGAVALVWTAAARRRPGFPAWSLGFPLIVCFFLTSKVFSPQWTTWLLPWFALALPDLRLFAAFEAADVAVFVTRFLWFARLSGHGGLPIEAFEVAVFVRAAILVVCLVAWVRREAPAVLTDGRAPGPRGAVVATEAR